LQAVARCCELLDRTSRFTRQFNSNARGATIPCIYKKKRAVRFPEPSQVKRLPKHVVPVQQTGRKGRPLPGTGCAHGKAFINRRRKIRTNSGNEDGIFQRFLCRSFGTPMDEYGEVPLCISRNDQAGQFSEVLDAWAVPVGLQTGRIHQYSPKSSRAGAYHINVI
jgi:hypothetical protein